MKRKKALSAFLAGLLMLYAVFTVIRVATHWQDDLWDFQAYYYAAKAHAAGLNPYGLASMAQVAGKPVHLWFTSPPYALWLFRPFALFDAKTASFLYLGFEFLLLAVLVWMWARFFLKKEGDPYFYPFTLLAFNSTLLVILQSGNISSLEQIGIWLAFLFLLKGRPLLFALTLILAASLKWTPLFFLVLILFTRTRRKWGYFFGGIGVFAALQGLSYLTSPYYRDFLGFDFMAEKGWGNPSAFSFFGDLQLVLTRDNSAYPTLQHVLLYAVFVLAVLAVTWRAGIWLGRMTELDGEDRTRILIFLGCLTYAVVGPRLMAYSQVILLPAAWFALKRLVSGKEALFFFFIAALQSPHHAAIPGMETVFGFLWMYYSFLLALALWVMYVLWIRRAARGGGAHSFAIEGANECGGQ